MRIGPGWRYGRGRGERVGQGAEGEGKAVGVVCMQRQLTDKDEDV